jgi:phosphoenolpyruvate-protein kinase (PTS system EI component)
MNALSIPRAKRIIRSVEYAAARAILEKTMLMKTASEMEAAIKKELHQLFGGKFKEFAPHSP